jgi:hypothetical protein
VKWGSITLSQGGEEYPTYSKKRASWIGHILHRNCLITYIEEKIVGRRDVTGGQGRRRKQLLDDLREMEDTRY